MYFAKKILSLCLTLWFAVTIVFVLFRMVPGDPTASLLGPLATADAKARLTADLGLDKSLLEQYWIYLSGLVQGDLGVSFSKRAAVSDIVFPAFANTLILVLITFALAYLSGAIFGVLLAWYRGTKTEAGASLLVLVLRGAPSFWLAILGINLFAVTLGWLPAAGMSDVSNAGGSLLSTWLSLDFLKHLILPVSVATVFALGLPLLLVRNTMLEVIGTTYMDLAEAKGIPKWKVMFRHGGRNALLPAVVAGAQFIAWAIGGMVVIENVFSWPGLGREIVDALEARDYQLAQGGLLLIAIMVVLLNLAADLIAAYLDPRVKLD